LNQPLNGNFFGRGIFNCLNNNTNGLSHVNNNATLAHSFMSLEYNGLLTITGNQVNQGNLTVSGTLQSFQTSVLATSSSVMDGKLGTLIGVSMPQFYTRNERVLGTTGTSFNQLNINDNFLLNSGGVNSYIAFRGTSSGVNNQLLGLFTNDFFFRLQSSSGNYKLQNAYAGDIWTMSNAGNVVNSGNLTISGTLQSFQTSL